MHGISIPEWEWIMVCTMAILGTWAFFIVIFHIGKENKHNADKSG